MKWDLELACRKCGKPYVATPWKALDVVTNPGLRDVITAPDFNMNGCPACGYSQAVNAPFILWEAHFNAVVLGQRFKIDEAIGVIKTLVDTRPDRTDVAELVIVFGVFEQLKKALTNTNLTSFRIPIWDLLIRDWSGVKHPLEDAADALVQRDMPERAFILYAEAIRHVPELYADTDVREKFLMSAHLAGIRRAPEQIDDRTALEQAQEYEEKLAHFANQGEFLAPYQVDYCPIDEASDMDKGFLEGDRHASTVALKHIELPRMGDYERVRGCLLVSFVLSATENWLGTLEPSLTRWRALNQMRFDAHWPRLHPNSKDELRKWFHSFTGASILE